MFVRSSKGLSLPLVLVVGLILGVLIAGLAVFIYSLQTSDKKVTPSEENQGIILSVSSPINNSVVGEETVEVKGTTGKDALVVIVGAKEDTITQTTGGGFTTKVTLREGDNPLTIYAFDTTTGENVQTPLHLLYLRNDLGASSALVAQANTDENTQETVEDLKNKLSTQSSELKKSATTFKKTFVVGSIESIFGTTLTLTSEDKNVKTVFTDDFTTFLSINNKSKSVIILEDLKRGERVAVVGLDKEDTAGNAKFIVRLNTTINKNHAILGKVKEIDGRSVILSNLSFEDQELSINIRQNASIQVKDSNEAGTPNSIKVDDILVVVGRVNNSGVLSARNIFVDPSNQNSSTNQNSTQSATQSN